MGVFKEFLKSEAFQISIILIGLILFMVVPAIILGMFSGGLAALWVVLSIIVVVMFILWVLNRNNSRRGRW